MEVGAEHDGIDGGFEVNKGDVVDAGGGVGGDGGFGAGGVVESQTREASDMEEQALQIAANVSGSFGVCGGGALRDVVVVWH